MSILNVSLGLPQSWGLYEIFSYYFESCDVLSNNEMLDVLLSSVITCDSSINYSYCVIFYENDTYTFTWFCINNDTSRIKVLGNDKLVFKDSTTKVYELGKFIKSLRYNMAKTGCCIARTKFLVWSANCISSDISKYILGFEVISSTLKLPESDYHKVVRFLSSDIRSHYKFTSSEFVNALSSSAKSLKIKSEENGELSYNSNNLFKDFSICTSTEVESHRQRAKWGVILDCEGNKDNASGLRELGGLIFCRYKNILLSVETFECTEVLLEETLQQVIKNYEVLINRYIPARGIDIFTFGGTDEFMIEDSLKNVSNKQFRKKIKRLFRFNDCRPYIMSYLNSEDFIINDKKTLSNIAKHLGVQVVSPKHSALADSRTLFNVLSFIFQETGFWISD